MLIENESSNSSIKLKGQTNKSKIIGDIYLEKDHSLKILKFCINKKKTTNVIRRAMNVYFFFLVK